jgi:hypothetical protein
MEREIEGRENYFSKRVDTTGGIGYIGKCAVESESDRPART